MGSQTAASIINKAAIILFDANNIKWSRTELLGWLNDAQRALVALVPEASSKVVSVVTVPGSRQTLPADGHMLLEISRNMGTTPGTTPGRVPRRIDRAIFEESNPNWSADTAAVAATVYMYNIRDKLAYYVYPPSLGTGFLEVIYSAIPVDLAEANPILVADTYTPALLDYLLWRAKSKDASFAGNFDEAQAYYKSFMTFVIANSTDSARLAADMGALGAAKTVGQGQGSIG